LWRGILLHRCPHPVDKGTGLAGVSQRPSVQPAPPGWAGALAGTRTPRISASRVVICTAAASPAGHGVRAGIGNSRTAKADGLTNRAAATAAARIA